jgi:hypothetical protein
VPTKVWFNGLPYQPDISGELTVSWEHRNRLASWSYADAGITSDLEPGTSYSIKIYGELGTLVHTEPGLTGTSWTYPQAMEIADSGLGRLNNHLRVQIYTVRGSTAPGRRSSGSWIGCDRPGPTHHPQGEKVVSCSRLLPSSSLVS